MKKHKRQIVQLISTRPLLEHGTYTTASVYKPLEPELFIYRLFSQRMTQREISLELDQLCLQLQWMVHKNPPNTQTQSQIPGSRLLRHQHGCYRRSAAVDLRCRYWCRDKAEPWTRSPAIGTREAACHPRPPAASLSWPDVCRRQMMKMRVCGRRGSQKAQKKGEAVRGGWLWQGLYSAASARRCRLCRDGVNRLIDSRDTCRKTSLCFMI